jgi:hypothetical protein
LSTTDTRDWRPLIFVAVLIFHIEIVLLVIRAARSPISSSTTLNEPLFLLLLPHTVRAPDAVTSPRPADEPPSVTSRVRTSNPSVTADYSTSVSPKEQEERPPKIDWEKEAELATQNATATADQQPAFRNLSALSPDQLSWVRQNQLEPTLPGIPWKSRRVEVTEGGFPIIHINDHCVAIPFLMMMVFCKIGHIEPKGDLFEHLRDLHDP